MNVSSQPLAQGMPLIESLTPREQEILALLAEGLTDREIAQRLHLSLSTVKWYNLQIYDKVGVRGRKQVVEQAKQLGLLAANGIPVHNLPSQVTPFVGRQQELGEIATLLRNPDVRLLTILAPGGMGKTRLALAVAESRVSRILCKRLKQVS